MRQDMPGEEIRLGLVRVAGQNERLDAHGLVGAQLGQHLVRIADDRRAAAGAGLADPGPEVVLDEAVARGRSQWSTELQLRFEAARPTAPVKAKSVKPPAKKKAPATTR